jgi:C4-dicarboxylate-specific signal transduction histidine kinase
MTDDHEVLAIEGVRFFGEMCASVSHEIKNVLAIINENAGLLQDMIGMQEKGLPLVPARLSRLAQSITRQVTRGDGIVKGMNRFAHSADAATEHVDVGELVTFMTQLTGRLIDMKGLPPRIEMPDDAVTVATNRFFLENLAWNCLCRAMDASPANTAVSIRVEKMDAGARIRFYGLEQTALNPITGFPSSQESAVASLLNVQLIVDEEICEICIILP